MSENNVAKKTLRKKYPKEMKQNLDDDKKKQIQSQPLEKVIFDKEKEIRFTIELIKYLKVELENTKAELALLKQGKPSTKESH
jgi:hypothetical protein